MNEQSLETPCIVVDYNKAMKNISTMQNAANQYNCKLRPHIKTHKSIEIAKRQIEAGASGITCAKISEAEVMANGGIEDIFVAYPLVGESKIMRAIALCRKIKRLILAVDSLICAEGLSRAAAAQGITLEVRMEVDTGAKRTGVMRQEAVDLAKAIQLLPSLNLTGVYTFKSLMYKDSPTMDIELAAGEECEILHELYLSLKREGISIVDISAGSTPTGVACAKTGLVNEVRPGTYVYYDQMTYLEGACEYDDIAACVYATVCSVPSPEYAILDGGTKIFSADVGLHKPPFNFHSYAYVVGREDIRLDRMNEEHGILTSTKGNMGLNVGDVLKLVPAHVCTSVNSQNHIYFWHTEDGSFRRVPVDARGMVY